MPLLSCSAVKCIYNENRLCQKGDIKVSGDHAQEACETCCASFRENTSGVAKNSFADTSRDILVDCSACTCCYNEDMECHAGQIDIAGVSACQCEQTECSTFRKE